MQRANTVEGQGVRDMPIRDQPSFRATGNELTGKSMPSHPCSVIALAISKPRSSKAPTNFTSQAILSHRRISAGTSLNSSMTLPASLDGNGICTFEVVGFAGRRLEATEDRMTSDSSFERSESP